MKHVKEFEAISKRNNRLLINKPEVGDAVVGLITARKGWDVDLKKFLNNTVGEVVRVGDVAYEIKYYEVPEEYKWAFAEFPDGTYFKYINFDNIRPATPQEKKDFLMKKDAGKYNI